MTDIMQQQRNEQIKEWTVAARIDYQSYNAPIKMTEEEDESDRNSYYKWQNWSEADSDESANSQSSEDEVIEATPKRQKVDDDWSYKILKPTVWYFDDNNEYELMSIIYANKTGPSGKTAKIEDREEVKVAKELGQKILDCKDEGEKQQLLIKLMIEDNRFAFRICRKQLSATDVEFLLNLIPSLSKYTNVIPRKTDEFTIGQQLIRYAMDH
jgi:hypothetical protein